MISIVKYFYHKMIKICTTIYCQLGFVHTTKIDINDDLLENSWPYVKPQCIKEAKHIEKEESVDLSIILPLYNSHKFIDGILESLVKQKTDYSYEIIVIDDGSSDDTAVLLKNWEEKYPQLIKVIYQENGGIARARNRGIENSSGRYIGFIDHDDRVKDNYIQLLLSEAVKKNADAVKCGISIIDIKNNHIIMTESAPYTIIDGTSNDDLTCMHGYVWGGIYRKSIFDHLRFPDKYWFEDFVTHPFIYRQCKTMVSIPDVLYYKVQHEKNAAATLWSSKNLKSIEQVYLAEFIPEGNRCLNLAEDWQMFRCILRESSGTLVVKTRGLDEAVKKQCFRRVQKLVKDYYDEEYLQYMNEHEKKWCQAFLKGDFFLWKVLTRY